MHDRKQEPGRDEIKVASRPSSSKLSQLMHLSQSISKYFTKQVLEENYNVSGYRVFEDIKNE